MRLGAAELRHGKGLSHRRHEPHLGIKAVWSGLQAGNPDEYAALEEVIVHRYGPDATQHSCEALEFLLILCLF
jgi:hypothetical protein